MLEVLAFILTHFIKRTGLSSFHCLLCSRVNQLSSDIQELKEEKQVTEDQQLQRGLENKKPEVHVLLMLSLL